MANSVSKINVVVGANTAGLQSGMNQASGIVSRGMGNVQTIAQQATFAVDDFFAAFSTGGVAGGLRGAGNNLTAIAASLGSIKAQLLIIAGLAVGQLLAKAFSGGKKDAEGLSKEIDRVADSMNRVREAREAAIGARDDIFWGGRGQNSADASKRLNEIRRELQSSSGVLERLQADRQEVANRFIPGTPEGNQEVMAHFRAIRDQELKALDEKIAKESEALEILKSQELAQTAVARRAREAVAPGRPGDRFGFFKNGPAAAGIKADLRLEQLKSLDPASLFGKLPGAHAFGSSGAISTINQAAIGPRNVQDAQLRKLDQIAKSTGDAARILGSKLPVAVEVAL